MPRTRTTFLPGHKGMGGRPKGSRNKANEDWRVAVRKKTAAGRLCDEVQGELERRVLEGSLSPLEITRFHKLVTKREKAQRTRSRHLRPVIEKRGLEIIHNKRSELETDAQGDGSGHVLRRPKTKEKK